MGCGCLTPEFIAKAHTNFTSILREVESQEEFVTRLDSLARHARDEHEWEGGKCDFHPLLVCSCGNCSNQDQLQCEGKPYRTKVMLKCKFRALIYEIELHERALQANGQVHPVLKSGHSNAVEASHNVLIRFRSKAIALQMTHYHVSTNLGLLQSNLTYMHQRCGVGYHWIPELFRRMGLPVFDGVQEALERDNEARKKDLERAKGSPARKKRVASKRKRAYEVGDYVCVHKDKYHIVCRIVGEFHGRYSLYCPAGVINRSFCATELMQIDNFTHIPLNEWRQAPKVPLSDAVALALVSECTCSLPECLENVIVVSSAEDEQEKDEMWVKNLIYSLPYGARNVILSPQGWLTDEIITAAQKLMHQHFPNMEGFQPPTLGKLHSGFDVHRDAFVQIINVKNIHWCVVSTVGCETGIINLYDSLYGSVDPETEFLIAGRVFSPTSNLTIRMVNVERQSNSSDCGVLAIAYAFDICSGVDPCKARYDSSRTRQHLATCLSDCNFSRFPVVSSERKCRSVKLSKTVELYCTCRLPERVGKDNMVE